MSERPDWNGWILQKNAEAKHEELRKSDYVFVEDLEKKASQLPFQHGSTIHLNRAVTNSKEGKTHGYEIHETTHDGKTIVHPNVAHQHLDRAMEHGRLRIGSEKSTKKHNLYWSAKVAKGTLKHPSGRIEPVTHLTPHGIPHTHAEKEKEKAA